MLDSKKLFSINRQIRFQYLAIVLLIGCATVFTPVAANAQKGTVITKSVRFAKGKSSAVVKGTAQAYTTYAYTLRAKEGQDMTVSLASPNDNVYFTVFSPGGLGALSGEEDLTDWTDTLPKTGTYKIMVFSKSDVGASSFTLKISID